MPTYGPRERTKGGVKKRALIRLRAVNKERPSTARNIRKGGITGREARVITKAWNAQGKPNTRDWSAGSASASPPYRVKRQTPKPTRTQRRRAPAEDSAGWHPYVQGNRRGGNKRYPRRFNRPT